MPTLHTSAYVSRHQQTQQRQRPHAHTAPASHTTTTWRLQRQYLYFRTIKASKLSTCRSPHAPVCQYSYFCTRKANKLILCTSKASKLNTSAVLTHHNHMLLSAACKTHGKSLQHLYFVPVSSCTFVPVKQTPHPHAPQGRLRDARQTTAQPPQVLTVLALLVHKYKYCFTGTKVQTPTQQTPAQPPQVLTVLALLVQKYKY